MHSNNQKSLGFQGDGISLRIKRKIVLRNGQQKLLFSFSFNGKVRQNQEDFV